MNLKKKLAWEGGGWQVRFFIPGGGWFLFCFFSFLWMVGVHVCSYNGGA